MSLLTKKFLQGRIVFNLVNNISKTKHIFNRNGKKNTWPVHANRFSSSSIYRANDTKYIANIAQNKEKKDTTETYCDKDQDEKTTGYSSEKAIYFSIQVESLRADLIVQNGLNITTNKMRTAFYESRIRVNEKRIFAKHTQLSVGDEIDYIKGLSPTNCADLVVSRLIIMEATNKEDHLLVNLKQFKTLLIENYADEWYHVS